HNFEKIELILMGGTFPSFPLDYQEEFVWGAFKAMNDFSKLFFRGGEFNLVKFKRFFELPVENLGDKDRITRTQKRLLKLKGKLKRGDLELEQRKNERTKIRCVALCIETRPDYCFEKEIKQLLKLGCTRVELGVQHLDNKVLEKIKRGHGVEETIKATKLLKDNLLKVGYHIMPGLPGSSVLKDKKMLVSLFENPAYRPDALKIYPCMVTKGTKLYELYKKGEYRPLTTRKAAEMIAWFKERIPEYVRVLRVQRDIPTSQTEAGVEMTNLRQYIHETLKPKCRCIRCREPKGEQIDFGKIEIKITVYFASEGDEVFIAAEAEDRLLGFCRLRIFEVEGQKLAGIRELHVYGTATGIGEEGTVQHRGLGKRLLQEAERIVKDNKIPKLKIISGIGARGYYLKLGYKRDGQYMSKVTEILDKRLPRHK
ncbi:MAG: tRNA uridine(34) 5-carboxymethylaminomethyl modification radical SAM/GNAT enzyme Elp3, partial [Candidatus Woesearchaeota archaeon]